jgi:L-rhamnose mutarotase
MEKGSVSNDRDSPRGKANGETCENLDAVKFEEMVRRHEKNWPSIKQDLKEAKANGLRSAAKIRHGYYDESKAVQWAKNRGKYHEKPSSRSWCDVGLQT